MEDTIKNAEVVGFFKIKVTFVDGLECILDITDNVQKFDFYEPFRKNPELFYQFHLNLPYSDIIKWNENFSLPGDGIRESAIDENDSSCIVTKDSDPNWKRDPDFIALEPYKPYVSKTSKSPKIENHPLNSYAFEEEEDNDA